MAPRLHDVFLALQVENDSTTKEAMISPAQDAALKKRLELKERALAKARGHQVNPAFVPGELADRRIGAPTEAAKGAYKTAPGLIDKSIQQQYGMSTPKQVAQKARRGAKSFWSGKSGLGSKWGNRAALIGGLGILGGGIKAYLDSRKPIGTPQLGESAAPQPQVTNDPNMPAGYSAQGQGDVYSYLMPQRPQDMSAEDYGTQIGDDLSNQILAMMQQQQSAKQANYSPSASSVAPPPVSPRVTAPGPSVAGIPQLKPGEPVKVPGMGSKGSGGSGSSGGSSAPKPPSMPKTAENEALAPLLAGAAGGVGGHMLGGKVIAPLMQMRERTLQAKITNAQEALKALQKTQQKAPAAMAAAGALLFAALTTLAIKKKQEERGPIDFSKYRPYDPTGAGFQQHQEVPFGY